MPERWKPATISARSCAGSIGSAPSQTTRLPALRSSAYQRVSSQVLP